MKKILQMIKNLPPELRMMLALAGLGTPLGAIYLLKRFLFPNTPTIVLIFIIAGVIAGLALLGFLIKKIFGVRGRKRNQSMASELAREDRTGPVSMDVRASIKANNEKFFNAVRDMKKNL